MMCLYILRCNRCCVSLQLCQLLCYQLPFLQNDVMAELLKLSLRCSADASFPASPSVSWSNVGLHPLNSKAVPHMFCYRRLSLVMWHASFTHQLQNIYEIYFCSHIRNGMGRGWRITSWRITESPNTLPLTFYMLYRENISPFRVREILFSYV